MVSYMKKFSPHKNASFYLKLSVIIAAVLIWAVITLYIPYGRVSLIAAIVLALIVVPVDLVYFPLYFRSLYYESDGVSITKHSGVFMKFTKAVEYSAVQYTASVDTPFSEHTGFNFAVLFVYGGQLRLSFLSKEDTAEILSLAAEKGRHEP